MAVDMVFILETERKLGARNGIQYYIMS